MKKFKKENGLQYIILVSCMRTLAELSTLGQRCQFPKDDVKYTLSVRLTQRFIAPSHTYMSNEVRFQTNWFIHLKGIYFRTPTLPLVLGMSDYSFTKYFGRPFN